MLGKARDTILRAINENTFLRALLLFFSVSFTVLIAFLVRSLNRPPETYFIHPSGTIERNGRVVYEWQAEDLSRRVLEARFTPRADRVKWLRALLTEDLLKQTLELKPDFEAVAITSFTVTRSTNSPENISARAWISLFQGSDRLDQEVYLLWEPVSRSETNPFGLRLRKVSTLVKKEDSP